MEHKLWLYGVKYQYILSVYILNSEDKHKQWIKTWRLEVCLEKKIACISLFLDSYQVEMSMWSLVYYPLLFFIYFIFFIEDLTPKPGYLIDLH